MCLCVCVCVCVCDCADVFVFVGDTKPVCTLPSPAICLCCTLGSVRMVWAPAVPPVTPALRLMPVQPPDTEAQPQLDCYHTTRIGSFSLSYLSIKKKKKKTHSKHSFGAGPALNYLTFKYKSTVWTYVGVGNLLVSVVANDVITRTQQIGYPLKGNSGTLV